MRRIIWMAVVLAGCSKDPLKQDVEWLCAIDADKVPISTWGPAAERQAVSDAVRDALAKMKDGRHSPREFGLLLAVWTQKVDIATCDLRDKLLVPAQPQ